MRAMDPALRGRLEALVRPLYQDLDGISRFDDVARLETLARALHEGSAGVELELLALFHRLGGWLARPGNVANVAQATGGLLPQSTLEATASSLQRLRDPETEDERAIASAIEIEEAGIRGTLRKLLQARREGRSHFDTAREIAVADEKVPSWMSAQAGAMLRQRTEKGKKLCRDLLEEAELRDLGLG